MKNRKANREVLRNKIIKKVQGMEYSSKVLQSVDQFIKNNEGASDG